ncbi:MAG: hypothetical protein PWP23_1710 [Candidatus Sumerlaeota bacterium]|nr:hypothetical protein [Candidatus Sumerlaeota bacterium]
MSASAPSPTGRNDSPHHIRRVAFGLAAAFLCLAGIAPGQALRLSDVLKPAQEEVNQVDEQSPAPGTRDEVDPVDAAPEVAEANPIITLEAALHSRDAAAARRAVEALAETEIDPDLLTYWQLEVLLVWDDPTQPVPPPAEDLGTPLTASIELRRALLLDLRGEAEEAAALYQDLAWDRPSLTPQEAAVLDERLASLAASTP